MMAAYYVYHVLPGSRHVLPGSRQGSQSTALPLSAFETVTIKTFQIICEFLQIRELSNLALRIRYLENSVTALVELTSLAKMTTLLARFF